jgi:uncharacterized membrane protein
MEFVILAGLVIAVFVLWQRVDRLQHRIERLYYERDEAYYAQPVTVPQAEPGPEPEEVAAAPAPEPPLEEYAEPEPLSEPAPDPSPEPEPDPAIIPASRIEQPVDESQVAETVAMQAEAGDTTVSEAEPVHSDYAYAEEPRRRGFDFEDIFGRLLPIWAGGVTLAVAGFFIVRYSIEAGLLTPPVRVLLSFLFGIGLLVGAEAAYRFERFVADERVRQALAGAGLATLYASFYLAGSHYGLIEAGLSFVGLALVTAAAILLSFRFGMPSAVLGLVGGFAAPLLVESDQANIPLLTTYLALVTGGLMLTARRRKWAWLGMAALGGGLGWGVLLLLNEVTGVADTLAMGGYLVLLGAVLPAFALSKDRGSHPLVDSAAGVLASMQMAVLVAQGGFELLSWGLYGLLALALAVLGWKSAVLRRASAVGGVIVLMLLVFWPDPSTRDFALVAGGMTAIFALAPLGLVLTGRSDKLDVLQLSGFALAMIPIVSLQFGSFEEIQFDMAGLSLGLALIPAIAAWKLWPDHDQQAESEMLVALGATTLAMAAAGLYATPYWAAPLVLAALGMGLLGLVGRREDDALLGIPWIAGLASLAAMFWTAQAEIEFTRLVGDELRNILGSRDLASPMQSALRWFVPALLFAALSAFDFRKAGRVIGGVLAAALTYGAAAQLLPGEPLAWFAAASAIALAMALEQRRAPQVTMLAIASLWALPWALYWLGMGFVSLQGEPMTIASDVSMRDIALYLTPALVASAALTFRHRDWLSENIRWAQRAIALLGLIITHVMFKQVIMIGIGDRFVEYGLLERTIWEALLLGAGAACLWGKDRFTHAGFIGWGLVGAALAHFTVYSLVLHNPLWSEQMVGPWPLANLLLPAYGLAIGSVVAARRAVAANADNLRLLADIVLMVLISLFALSELRHAFTGSIMSKAPLTQVEEMLRSVTGILLAIGYLLWGAFHKQRSWRIGSLVIMLVAVCKVFLFDAAGLQDLARIASFVALGFSLIGIGWFYSRQLKREPAAETLETN